MINIGCFGGSTINSLAICVVLVFEFLGAVAVARWLGSKPTISKFRKLYFPSETIGSLAIVGTGVLAITVYLTGPTSDDFVHFCWSVVAPLGLLDKLVGGTIRVDNLYAIFGGCVGWLIVLIGLCSTMQSVSIFRRERSVATSHSAAARL